MENTHNCIYCKGKNVIIWQTKKELFKCKDCNIIFSQKSNPLKKQKNNEGRVCLECEKFKSYKDFYKRGDGYRAACKECYKNKEYFNSRFRHYSITKQKFKEILINQDNKCKICEKQFENEKLCHIDHNHTNNKIRGLLCPGCNLMIGLAADDIKILENAIKYLIVDGE